MSLRTLKNFQATLCNTVVWGWCTIDWRRDVQIVTGVLAALGGFTLLHWIGFSLIVKVWHSASELEHAQVVWL